MPNTLSVALISVITGAIAGAFMSLYVNIWHNRWQIRYLTRNISILLREKTGSGASIGIINNSIFPIRATWAYITIEHEIDDILKPPGSNEAFIVPKGHEVIVKEDRLCWAVKTSQGNPPVVDIYPGEQQILSIANIEADWIEIPSEMGRSSEQSEKERNRLHQREHMKSRVFLKRKKYSARVKIVSMNTRARCFDITIDPEDEKYPLK